MKLCFMVNPNGKIPVRRWVYDNDMEYIVHGSKIGLCCKKLTYFGAYLLTVFRPIIYRSWSRTGVPCVGSGFGGIIWL